MSDAEDLEKNVAAMAQRVINHMNADHADSLLAYCHYYAEMPDAKSAQMSGLTSKGFEVDVRLSDGSTKRKVLIAFDPPLTSAGQVRKIAVNMHFAAYNGLGLGYKVRNGFYSGALRQAWTHMPKRVRIGIVGTALGVIGAITFLRRHR